MNHNHQPVGLAGHDPLAAHAALYRAYALGLTHWDTADVYGEGRAERFLGDVLASGLDRSRIFLASKVGWDLGPYDHPYHPDHIATQLDRTLTHLRTDALDLYYFHHADFGPDDRFFPPALDAFLAAREARHIRYIGLSDASPFRIMGFLQRVAPAFIPDVIQTASDATTDAVVRSGLAAYCLAHDVGLVLFSPLRHGLLLGNSLTPRQFPDGDVRSRDPAFGDPPTLARLAQAAATLRARFGARTPEPVLGALYAAARPPAPPTCVLTAVRTPAQVDAALYAAAFAPSPAERAAIRALYADLIPLESAPP